MNRFVLLLLSAFLLSCASSANKELDSDEQFERLYVALGMDDIMASMETIEIDNSEIILRGFSHLPQEVQDAMLAAMGTKSVIESPINREVAKEVFRTVLVGLLSAEELSIAADFYSSEAGLKIHHAIIDGENAVSEYLDSQQ